MAFSRSPLGSTRRFRRVSVIGWLASLCAICLVAPAMSQPPTPDQAMDPNFWETMVAISIPARSPLENLLGLVSARTGIRYQYSAEIGAKVVSIQSPTSIPRKAIPYLLNSVLRAEGLAVVNTDIPGTKEIVKKENMPLYAPTGTAGIADQVYQSDGPDAPVTEIFLLKKLDPTQTTTVITKFSPSASVNPIAQSNVLLVTDYARNLKKIEELLGLIDSPIGETTYQFYDVKNQPSKSLTEQVRQVFEQKELTPRRDGEGEVTVSGKQSNAIRLFDDTKGNRILVIGWSDLVKEAMGLLKQFDVALGMDVELYRPKNLSAERLNKLIEGILPEQDVTRAYQATVDDEGNILVVRATPDIHAQIKKVIAELDKTAPATESKIRVHKLKNARANEVLQTLLALQEAYGAGFFSNINNPFFGGAFGGLGIPSFSQGLYGGALGGGLGGLGTGFGGMQPGMGGLGGLGGMGGLGAGMMGGFNPFAVQTQQLPLQPGQPTTPGATTGMGGTATGVGGGAGGTGGGRGGRNQRNQQQGAGALAFGGTATLPGGARVSADVATNSLIVVAPPSIQPIYERLIQSLDQRRPQVMIEAKLIAVDTTDAVLVGVETSLGDRTGSRRAFKFTSYGLSEVNPTTGALRITPGRGFNGTVVDPEIADLVVRALSTHTRSKVLASPRIVVNDNETGTFESVVSVPFSSVNASNTVSTTSLGGTQEAGTTILVTPQINEDDNLLLQFDIEFSSFSGSGTATLPPARQIQTVSSVVTIPDGQTVIVGGLNRTGARQEYAGIPWIEKIPIVRDLTGRTDESRETTSFFVFIRPIILRDSRFQDLQFLSDREAGIMGIPSEYPTSQPLLMQSNP